MIRHGETRLNKAGRVQGINDEPLNVTGRAQARVVSTALAYDQPFHLYASPWLALLRPLKRCRMLIMCLLRR